jgi:hypothetical protein
MPIQPSIIDKVIAIAEQQTRSIRAPVTHIHKIADTGFGPQFADPVVLEGEQAALVEDETQPVPTTSGIERATNTKLTFFFPLEVTDSDRFRLGDSMEEWGVMKIRALRKPDHTPYMVEVWLGSRASQT